MSDSSNRPSLQSAAKGLFTIACVVVFPIVILLITADTLLRYFANAPIPWAQDAAGVALFLLFCAGLPYSWFGHFHVRMDMIYLRLHPGVRRVVDIAGIIGAFILGTLLAYRGVLSAINAFRTDASMPSGVIPLWPIQFVGAFFLVFFCIAMLSTALSRRRGSP